MEQVRVISQWLIILFLIGIPYKLGSQTSTGQIDIEVRDASGAVVPGAHIQVSSADSGNVARTLSSNGTGIAAVTLLQPGKYNIAVSFPGFETAKQEGIAVRVGETLNIPIALKQARRANQ